MTAAELGPRLGTGKRAEVYEYGDNVIKLYAPGAPKGPAFREAAILASVEGLGLPVPSVKGVRTIGDRWGIVMTRAGGPSWADAAGRDPKQVPERLGAMAALHVRINSHEAPQFAPLKAKLAANIRRARMLGAARERRLLAGLAERPDGNRLCHGDFHPWNILGPIGGETVVDWLDATSGDPAADACRSSVLMHPHLPDVASAYIDAYAAASGFTRTAILAWQPIVAAARLAEGVPEETEALMAMVGEG